MLLRTSLAFVLAVAPVTVASSEPKPAVLKTEIEIEGWTFHVKLKGRKARVEQGTLWTRDKIEVLSRARRALKQALPHCVVQEENWTWGILEAFVECDPEAALKVQPSVGPAS